MPHVLPCHLMVTKARDVDMTRQYLGVLRCMYSTVLYVEPTLLQVKLCKLSQVLKHES
jgi:hypothetical protein